MRSALAALSGFVLATAVLGGACGNGQQGTPPAPATHVATTPNPASLANTDADALRIISKSVGRSTGAHSMANLTDVQWVRTTIRGANMFFPQINPQPASGSLPASDWSTPVWIFQFHGDFTTYNRLNPGKEPVGHTFYMLVAPNSPGEYETEAMPYDLAQLGTVHVVNRGDSPQIDALRAPDAPAPGATATAAPGATPPP